MDSSLMRMEAAPDSELRALHWPWQSSIGIFSRLLPAAQFWSIKKSTDWDSWILLAEVGAAMNTKNTRAKAASLLFILEAMGHDWKVAVSEIVSTTTDVAIVHTFQAVGIERVVFVNKIEVSD